jgi:hypothetical protein
MMAFVRWLCVYAGQFIAATEPKGELCGRINEEKNYLLLIFINSY